MRKCGVVMMMMMINTPFLANLGVPPFFPARKGNQPFPKLGKKTLGLLVACRTPLMHVFVPESD